MLAALLAVSLIPALGEEADEPSPLGDWYTDLGGVALRLTLNADGSYVTVVLGDESDPGVWTLEDGCIVLDGDEDRALYFNGVTLSLEEANLLFTREAPDTAFAPAPLLNNPISLYFEGHWVSEFVDVNGEWAPAEYVEDDTEIWIEIDLPAEEPENPETVDVNAFDALAALGGQRFGDVIQRFAYADGGYTAKLPDSDATVTLRLTETLQLQVTIQTPDSVYTLYLSRVLDDAEEEAE